MKKCIEYLGLVCAGCVALLTLLALGNADSSHRLNASVAAISHRDAQDFLRQIREDIHPSRSAAHSVSADGRHLVILSAREGRADTIVYTRGECADLAETPNPSDFPIYRRHNGENPEIYSIGAVDLDFQCDRAVQRESTSDIPTLHIALETEPPFPVDGQYKRLAFQLSLSRER